MCVFIYISYVRGYGLYIIKVHVLYAISIA